MHEVSGALLAFTDEPALTFWTSYRVLRQASVFLLEALCLRVWMVFKVL